MGEVVNVVPEFEEGSHTYRVDGRVKLSVTQILKAVYPDVYANIPAEILDRKARLGTATHKVIELYLNQRLDDKSVHAEVRPYFDSWLAWWAKNSTAPFKSERKFYCVAGDYCGAIDFEWAHMPIDWKITGTKLFTHELQITGYAFESRRLAGACLYLKDDGSPAELAIYDVVKLMPDWLATLRVHNIKRRMQ